MSIEPLARAQAENDNVTKGILFALSAYFLFAIMTALAKHLFNEGYHIIEIAFYRNLIALFPFFIIFQLRGGFKKNIPVNKKGIFLRSLIGAISLVVTFGTFAHLPMADATAMIFGSTLVVPILAHFFLKEHVGLYRWGAVVLGFVGILIMAQPTGATNWIGIGFALATVMCHATIQTMVRWIGRTDTPFVITFYFIALGTLFCGVFMPFIGSIPSSEHILLFLAVGAIGSAGQFCITSAFKNTQASIVTIFNYSGIIWATSIGWIIWGDWPTLAIWVGGSIVIASNLFIIYRESRKKKPNVG